MADRVAVMRAGTIEQCDEPSRIYDEPLTPFVAEFIGQANRFEGRLADGRDGRAVVVIGEREDPLPARNNPACRAGDRIIAMVRPERIRIGERGLEPSAVVRGRIVDKVFVGEKITIYLETSAGTVAAAIANPGRGPGAHFKVGDVIDVTWAADDFVIFPALPP